MIFSELYSAYYNAVAKIISEILSGDTNEKELNRIVCETAFGESVLTVLPALKSGKWQLLYPNMTTPLKKAPTMPRTLLQKRWLKAISLDPRIQLFDICFEGLEDVEPLFTPADYVLYDRYSDGDPYNDEAYIAHFRTALRAVKNHQPLRIEMCNRKGNLVEMTVMPQALEYSEKDDKFRLLSTGCRYGGTVNLARMVTCEPCEADWYVPYKTPAPMQKCVTLRILDERNALERCMLHFAHFKKRAERVDKKHYLVRIWYDRDDETEMVIRVLSFGPLIEVTEPNSFRQLIIKRLQRQKGCELF